ncbi:protein-S-isoprenylcysteine O-methyltransferase Ste14 [Brevundimonas bullata]|uniref:Protein-S-isoprenylcysteine O-methyltransferase Ste14 n=1 Tax=Brevundimonas bullata TaxID=13160 RepID=A0A7W7N2T1_9CAUL|nr:isoprenylcysteine carboxylmethyltransferase family protein [Brevundimonas bullata]MBB4796609.1 protein-S-isoprenylcysteine O-methyltransferase Ste14 [Brevundimonas bullata]MBB6381569.1 protein-S-isoprenylcysteine O-methyltransferase Ste14 [Brevundimonas bullata]
MTTRDHPGVIAPPPLIYLGFLLAGYGVGQLVSEPSLGLDVSLRRGLAFVLVIAGLLLDGIAAGTFRRLGTPPEPWKPTTALATGGLYKFSRNPIYVGFAVTYAGFAMAMDSPVALALLVPCLMVVDRFVIQREERYLSAKFGAEYQAYQGKVRRWL